MTLRILAWDSTTNKMKRTEADPADVGSVTGTANTVGVFNGSGLLISSSILPDTAGVAAANVNTRALTDTAGDLSIDWGNRALWAAGSAIATWTNTGLKISGSTYYPYSFSTPASGPSIQWWGGSYNADIGLYIQTGLVFQGDAGNPNFYVREATTDGTLGAISVQLGGTSNPSYFMTTVGIGTNYIPSGIALHVSSGDLFLDDNRLRFNYNNSTPGSGPAIKWTTGNDSNTIGIYINTGIVFQGDTSNPRFTIREPTGTSSLGTEKIRFDAAASPGVSFINVGNLGIGTESPSHKLEIVDAPSSQADFIALSPVGNGTSEGVGIGIKFMAEPASVPGIFSAGRIYGKFDGNNAEDQRLTLQSTTGGNVLTDTMSLKNGRVGIGTTTPATPLHVTTSSTATPRGMMTDQFGNNTNGAQLAMRKSRGTAGSPTAVVLNDHLGDIAFIGHDGTAYSVQQARVSGFASENWATGAHGTYISFATTQNGTTSSLDRVRIDNVGNLLVGTTSPAAKLAVSQGNTAGLGVFVEVTDTSNTDLGISVTHAGAGITVAYLSSTDAGLGESVLWLHKTGTGPHLMFETSGSNITISGATGTYDLVLPPDTGTAGQFLQSLDGTGALVWATAGGLDVEIVTGNISGASGKTYLVDTSSGAITVTLPSPAINSTLTIKDMKGQASTNNVTIAQFASENIEGVAGSYLISTDWGSVTLVSDGTDWFSL